MFLSLNCRKPFLFFNSCFKQAKLCSTKASNNSLIAEVRPKSVLLDKSNYKVIYEFPYIRLTAAILRSRFSIPLLSSVTAPVLIYFDEAKVSVLIVLSAYIHYLCASAFANLTKNIVGYVYVNEKSDVGDVIISAVDEKGRRIDKSHDPNDFINCDFPNKFSQYLGLVKISLENSDVHYKVNIRHCKIYDIAVCNNLFGNMWVLPPKNRTKDNISKPE